MTAADLIARVRDPYVSVDDLHREFAAALEAAEAKITEALVALDNEAPWAESVRMARRILSADAPTEPVQGDAKLQQNSGGWFVSSHGVAVAYVEPVTDRGAALIVDGTILPPNSASALREFFAADAPTVPAPVLEREDDAPNGVGVRGFSRQAPPEVTDTLVDDVYALFVTAPGGMTGREAMRAALTAALGGTDT